MQNLSNEIISNKKNNNNEIKSIIININSIFGFCISSMKIKYNCVTKLFKFKFKA